MNEAVFPRTMALVLCLVSFAPFLADRTEAATVYATIAVGTTVIENCATLLNSSTTIITASYACRTDSVATTLSPTVSSTSLAVLAPSALFGQTGAATGFGQTTNNPGATAAKTAAAAAALPLNESISIGPTTSQFITSISNNDDQIVMITY